MDKRLMERMKLTRKAAEGLLTVDMLTMDASCFYSSSFHWTEGGNAYGMWFGAEAFAGLADDAIEDLCREFSSAELLAMINAAKWIRCMPHNVGTQLRAFFQEEGLRDADSERLRKRLDRLSRFERAALEMWCKKYWVRYDSIDIEDYVSRMAQDTEIDDAEFPDEECEDGDPAVDCDRTESSGE